MTSSQTQMPRDSFLFSPFAAKHKTATVESSTRRLIDPTGWPLLVIGQRKRACVLGWRENRKTFFFARKDHEVEGKKGRRGEKKNRKKKRKRVLRRPIFWDKSGERYDRCLWPFSLCPPSNLSIGHCINEPCYRDIDNMPLFLFIFFAIFTLYFSFIDRVEARWRRDMTRRGRRRVDLLPLKVKGEGNTAFSFFSSPFFFFPLVRPRWFPFIERCWKIFWTTITEGGKGRRSWKGCKLLMKLWEANEIRRVHQWWVARHLIMACV